MPARLPIAPSARLRIEPLEDRTNPVAWGLDPTFGGDGIAETSDPTFNIALDLTRAPDGKLVIASYASEAGRDYFAVGRFTTDGRLDPTFGGDGFVTTPVGSDSVAWGVAVQPDGKIVAVGGVDGAIAVVRYNPDGSLDPTFGIGGVVTTPVGTDAMVYDVAIQPDGKIVAGGTAEDGAATDLLVVRYGPDGTLDPTFGGDGVVTTDFGFDDDGASNLVLQPDGKIVLVGSTSNGPVSDFAVARYNPDGSLDATFGGDGRVTVDTAEREIGNALAARPDGRLVIAGTAGPPNQMDFRLVGLTATGEPDAGFGTLGVVIAEFGTAQSLIFGLDLGADGKLVAVGQAGDEAAVARFNADGSPDDTFSDDGRVTTDLAFAFDTVDGVIALPDGRIVLGGGTVGGVTAEVNLVQYLPDGGLDPSFGGGGGFVSTEFGDRGESAQAVAQQADGKLVVAGFVSQSGPDRDIALARYLPDGRLDPAFGTGGRVVTALSAGVDVAGAVAVAVQLDGKVVVTGQTSNGTGFDFAVVRYNPDGSLDETFGTGGTARTAFGRNGYPSELVVQPDGKILVVGVTDDLTQVDCVLVRYNPDGSPDDTFDGDGILSLPLSTQDDWLSAVTVLADGRIQAAGRLLSGTQSNALVLRFNADGSPDPTFGGGDGRVIEPVAGNGSVSSMAVAADGSFVLGGSVRVNPELREVFVARYTAAGTPDPTFGTGGVATAEFGATLSNYLMSVAFTTDGKIVGVCDTRFGEFFRPAAVRFNSDGTLDPTFDGDGKVIAPDAGRDVPINAGLIQADGKLVAVGSNLTGIGPGWPVLRFGPDNRPPAVVPTTLTLPGHHPISALGSSYVSDPDGESVTVTLVSGPAHGTLTLQPNGDFTYTPDLSFTGYDQFLYRVTDADGAYADGAVTVNVTDADGIVVAVRDDPALPGQKSLYIVGTAGPEDISVRPQGSSKTAYTVTVNDGAAERVAGVTGRIYLTGGDGADAVRLAGVRIPAVIDAGGGDDTVTGGAGADTLTGGLGNDVLDGGAGRDRLIESTNGDMTLVSGTATKNGRFTGIGTDTLARNRIEEAELTAGPGADVIDASAFAGRTTLAGGDGFDILRAGRGDALLIGGDGDDQFVGGPGRDILLGGDGADVLTGGTERDILIGGLGADVLTGEAGGDMLVGGLTAFDNDRPALAAVQAEWTSGARYGVRVKRLTGERTDGRNAPHYLTAATVADDHGMADTLTGAAGVDWFLRDTGDQVRDRKPGETLTEI